MKFLPLVVLSLFAIPAHADLLGALEQNQASLPSEPGVSVPQAPTGVTSPTVRPSDTNTRCDEDKQTSLPLKYLTGLLLQKDGKLEINHDPTSGTLRVSSAAKMIGNCNSMIEWSVRTNEIDGRKVYAVEAKFRDGESCPASVANPNGYKCYKFTKIGSDKLPVQEAKPFNNDIRGFQSCLEASGVVGADGKINSAAIFKQPVQESFSGLEETGKLVFLSHGPVSSQVDPRFGLERVNGCDVYEKIHPTISMVYSTADLDSQRLQAEADSLRNCQPNEYQRLVDFIERNGIQSNLEEIRDRLIKQVAEATAKKIAENKELTEEDMKVISDFERYIVDPKRKQIADLFLRMESLEGTELQNARTELNRLRTELESFARAPYFQKVHVEKLLAKGMFADAERMEGIRIGITESAKIGKREGNVTVTPDMARVRIANSRGELANRIVAARENYDIRTGVTTGMSQTYRDLAASMRRNIERRTQNYTQEIQNEYARLQQPSGYCFRYFRNTQKCVQDSLQRIQELQNSLAHYNKIDNERAIEYDAKAQSYSSLEQEGRRYIAAQNGEEAPREEPVDTTAVPQRTEDQNAQAAAQAAAAGQQSMMPPWMMNQTQPYGNQTMMNMNQNPYAGMYGQQNTGWMGQAGFNAGFGYQGTMGQNYMGMQQPQYGNVGMNGMNWFGMGQGVGQQMVGGQPMFGQQQPMWGQQQPMYAQSPYGQMYGQSPYMQGGLPAQPSWMQQGYGYPNLYAR